MGTAMGIAIAEGARWTMLATLVALAAKGRADASKIRLKNPPARSSWDSVSVAWG